MRKEIPREDFFEHVVRRTEEILSQSSFGSDDRYVSEVLTHVDLLERTIRLPDQLATIVTNETDDKRLHDLRLVFTELLEKFLQHFGPEVLTSSLSCSSWTWLPLPLSDVHFYSTSDKIHVCARLHHGSRANRAFHRVNQNRLWLNRKIWFINRVDNVN